MTAEVAQADEVIPREAEEGYAGSFFVFGHGRCFSDAGRCEVPRTAARGPYDRRPPHQLTPHKHIVVPPPEIARRAAESRVGRVMVPVVPAASDSPAAAEEGLFWFERLAPLACEV